MLIADAVGWAKLHVVEALVSLLLDVLQLLRYKSGEPHAYSNEYPHGETKKGKLVVKVLTLPEHHVFQRLVASA